MSSYKSTSIIVVLVSILCYIYKLQISKEVYPPPLKYNQLTTPGDQIETIFLESWYDYVKYGFGYDIYHPISHTGENMPSDGNPLGWIIVDSIDTMMLMYNSTSLYKDEFHQEIMNVESWVANELDYSVVNAEINIFETTIRMLGGLLSAYYLSNELNIPDSTPQVYLQRAIQLADRLTPAFSQSQTGIPFSSINLLTGRAVKNHQDNGASSTAEFTTLQLEFK